MAVTASFDGRGSNDTTVSLLTKGELAIESGSF